MPDHQKRLSTLIPYPTTLIFDHFKLELTRANVASLECREHMIQAQKLLEIFEHDMYAANNPNERKQP